MDYGMELNKLDYSPIFRIILKPITDIFYSVLFTVLTVFFAMLVYALLKYKINLFRLKAEELKKKEIRFQLFDFLRWMYIDIDNNTRNGIKFNLYGFTLFCGRQGGGKTTSMVDYLNRMHKRFPKALIVTNFWYKYATHRMESWRDFFEIRNGTDGVIFAIDEVHSEFSTAKSKDFPESMLSEISQQRKQRMKIVATSQVYSRVAKPIREQTFSVVQCETYLNRWTFTREYDADDYDQCNNYEKLKRKFHAMYRHSFVQSDDLRECFDTYEKIEKIKDEEFLTRMEH